jgi:opacity protein-like surface antigen
MIRHLTAVLAAAAFAAPALATDALSSSYWDAAYLNSDRKDDSGGPSERLEGFRLGASIGLAKFLNFTGDYEQRRRFETRIGTGSAGLAYHTQHPVYRFHFGASYERVEVDNNADPSEDNVEEGYGVEVGARYALPNVGLHAGYRYLDFGVLDGTDLDFTGARYGAGVDVQLSPWWSLVADYRVREHTIDGAGVDNTVDYNEWTVGFRRYFATDSDRRLRRGGLLTGSGDEAEGS